MIPNTKSPTPRYQRLHPSNPTKQLSEKCGLVARINQWQKGDDMTSRYPGSLQLEDESDALRTPPSNESPTLGLSDRHPADPCSPRTSLRISSLGMRGRKSIEYQIHTLSVNIPPILKIPFRWKICGTSSSLYNLYRNLDLRRSGLSYQHNYGLCPGGIQFDTCSKLQE